MKRYLNIATFFLLVLTVESSLANTNGGLKIVSQEKDTRKPNQTMIRPDGDVDSAQEQENQTESASFAKETEDEVSEVAFAEVNTDSIEDDSVSKYNFIFYFLYKFKYESEE